MQLHHHSGAEGRVVLGAADALGQLPAGQGAGGELAVVVRHKHWVKAGGGRPTPVALARRLDRPLPDRFGVTGWHAKPVAGEGFAQRRPGGAQLGCGGVDAAQPLGQGEAPLGFAPIGQERLGCQPTPF